MNNAKIDGYQMVKYSKLNEVTESEEKNSIIDLNNL